MSTTTLQRPSFLSQLPPEARAERVQAAKAAHGVVAKVAGASVVRDYFELHKGKIQDVLPPHVSVNRLLAIALDAIRRKPQLLDCTVSSLFGAVVLCAKMGLEPDTHRGHVYLIPRSKRRPMFDDAGQKVVDRRGKQVFEDTWEVHVQLGYKGRIELAYRSPMVRLLKAVLVYSGDMIEISEGTEQVIRHHVDIRKPRGEIIGVYAICRLSTGETLFEPMDLSEIHRIRDENSDAYSYAATTLAKTDVKDWERKKAADTPWISDFGQMAKKTAINRIDSYIPSPTAEMVLASAIDNADIEGVAQDLDAVIAGEDIGPGEREPEDDGQKDAGQESTAADESGHRDTETSQITHEQTISTDLGGDRAEADRIAAHAAATAAAQADLAKAEQSKPTEDKQKAPKERKAAPAPAQEQQSFDDAFGDAE